jgi:hypothetical protein
MIDLKVNKNVLEKNIKRARENNVIIIAVGKPEWCG